MAIDYTDIDYTRMSPSELMEFYCYVKCNMTRSWEKKEFLDRIQNRMVEVAGV